MNRTIKDAAVKRFDYDSHDQLPTHLEDFMAAYNFARRLKTLSGLTPYEYACKVWTSEPVRFIVNRIHQMPGLNTKSQTENCFYRAVHLQCSYHPDSFKKNERGKQKTLVSLTSQPKADLSRSCLRQAAFDPCGGNSVLLVIFPALPVPYHVSFPTDVVFF
jgi:hypothetical protein